MGNIAIGFENGYSLMIVADGNGRVKGAYAEPKDRDMPETWDKATVMASSGVRNFGAGQEVLYRICSRESGTLTIMAEVMVRNLKIVDLRLTPPVESIEWLFQHMMTIPELWEVFAV